jgi:hypothetical protein
MQTFARGVLLSALLSFASPARGESPELARAITIGREGVRLYEERSYAAAYRQFEVADRMAHSVVFVLYMARCKRNLGELVAARALLERVAREPLPAAATEPMHRAQQEARAELEPLKARIPSIVLRVTGAPTARIRVDRRPVEAGVPLDLDPGEHTVEVTGDDVAPVVRTIRLQEGAARSVLELGPVQQGAARGPIWPGAVVLGVGVASVGVGAVTGAMAMSKASAIKENCVEEHCRPGDRSNGATAETLATVSTVAFVTAGVAAVGGVVLLWVRPGGPASAVEVTARPGQLWIRGAF